MAEPWWRDRGLDAGAQAFAERFAERSSRHGQRTTTPITVEQLRQWGRFPEPCSCGDAVCEGWVMNYAWEDALVEDRIRTAKARLAK